MNEEVGKVGGSKKKLIAGIVVIVLLVASVSFLIWNDSNNNDDIQSIPNAILLTEKENNSYRANVIIHLYSYMPLEEIEQWHNISRIFYSFQICEGGNWTDIREGNLTDLMYEGGNIIFYDVDGNNIINEEDYFIFNESVIVPLKTRLFLYGSLTQDSTGYYVGGTPNGAFRP